MKRKLWNSIYNVRFFCLGICIACCLLLLSACGEQKELVNMGTGIIDDKQVILWEERTYILFCVVSKTDCEELIGYVNGDPDNRISAYKDFSPEEWLVNWMPMDGGAFLLKEENVVDIPVGLEAEY